MAKDWYLIGQPQIYNGGYEGQEWENYAQDGFSELLHTTMLRDEVEYISSDFKRRKKGLAVVQGVSENTQDKYDERQILTPIGVMQKFSYVKFKDDIWLIAAEPSDNKFYEKAPLKLCNNKLRWQDELTKEIHEYYFWTEDGTQYSSGIYKGNVIIQYDKQYNVSLPLDYNTRKLHDGMRFMLEKSNNLPLVYKLTKYEGIVFNNKNIKLLNLTLTQTVYDKDRDNADLMIADYYDVSSQEKITDYNCEFDYVTDEISLSSSAKFTLIKRNEKGKKVDLDFEYEWQISDCDFEESYLTLSSDNNTVTIYVANEKDIIGHSFVLNAVSSEDGTIVATIKIKIVPLW